MAWKCKVFRLCVWVLASLDGASLMTATPFSFLVFQSLRGLVVIWDSEMDSEILSLYLSSSMMLGSGRDTHSTS